MTSHLSAISLHHSSNRSAVFIVCCVSALIRILFVSWQGEAAIKHMEDYQIAVNLSSGNGYCITPASGPTAIKAPLYPFFLAAIFSIAPQQSLVIASIIQHLLIAFCPYLFFILLQPYVKQRIALTSALAFSLHPSYWVYPSTLEVTNLFVPLCLLTLYAVQARHQAQREARSTRLSELSIPILLALVVLCQPICFPVAVLAIWFLYSGVSKRLLALAICLLMWTPWTIRNEVVFQRFIPFKSSVWMNVYMGFDVASHGIAQLNTIDTLQQKNIAEAQRLSDDVVLEEQYKSASLQALQAQPVLFAEKFFVQAWRYWTIPPKYDQSVWNLSFAAGRLAPLTILAICTLAVFILPQLRRKPFVRTVLFVLVYFTVVYSLSHTQNIRFKLDVEWLQCFFFGLVLSSRDNSDSVL